MGDFDLAKPISRRHALGLGGGAAAGMLTAGGLIGPGAAAARSEQRPAATDGPGGSLPVDRMQEILQAKGTFSHGVLSISLDREDIEPVHLRGVLIKAPFEVDGTLTFQPLRSGRTLFNGDLALKPNEINPFIDAILANGLVFQAEHQHFYDFDPPVWFIHWRGVGDALALARAVHNVITTTSISLPQAPPENPTTPLDPGRLQSILHGYDFGVEADGVVTVFVERRNPIYIEGIHVLPSANIATNVSFQPLSSRGSQAAVAPDFAMEGSEVDRVVRVMRARGWDIGCLYNQETNEYPQLFFSHQFKTGDAYELAAEVRLGLDQTNAA